MGCTSSKQQTSAFVHPGNRRHANKPYVPSESQFSNGQAISHFVSYGGGNALVLKQGCGAQPQIGAATARQPEYIQVTLPAGVFSGETIQVQAPDGRLNEIIIPQGFREGSTFTVEFTDTQQSSPSKSDSQPSIAHAIAAAVEPVQPNPQSNSKYDDGFASGFQNPNFIPQATSASSTVANDYSYYPTATDAQPINFQPTGNFKPYVD